MEMSPSSEAASCAVTQELSSILWKLYLFTFNMFSINFASNIVA
jgi:hypothetical protein